MDDYHPAFRRRAGDGPVFSSRKCPNGPGLKHSCELPFGFVWTPMSPSNSCNVAIEKVDVQETNLPPILCLNCLCYLNLYAAYEEATGFWTCPFCQTKNVAPSELFGTETSISPAMISPIVEYRQKIDARDTSSPQSYVVIIDANLPSVEAHAVAESVQNLLLKQVERTKQPVTLVLLIFESSVSIYQLGIAGLVSADVVQPDLDDDGVNMKNEEEEILEEEARQARVPLRSYYSEIHQEKDFESFKLCISAVFGLQTQEPPVKSLSRKEILRRRKQERLNREKGNIVNEEVGSPWVNKKKISPELTQRPPRCTGEAIQCALEVASFSSLKNSSSRILLFTNGCPNLGNGNIVRVDKRPNKSNTADVIDHPAMMQALKYFEALGKEALESYCIGIDVFLSGVGSLGLQAYQALVDPSGGYALPYDSFASNQFKADLNYVITHTHVPQNQDKTVENINSIDGCIVDVRMSDFITASHVVGAMEVCNENTETSSKSSILSNERAAFAMGASLSAKRGLVTNNLPSDDLLADTLTRVRMGRYDPLSTLSFMLRVDEVFVPDDDKYAFFQCIVRYVDQDGRDLVTRVSTYRLPVAVSIHDFLDSMDEEVVPVVLGKEAVFRSIIGRDDEEAIDALVVDTDRVEMLAFEAQKDLDNTIHRISGAYRLIGLEVGTSHKDFVEEGGVSSAHSSLGFAFPPELADALHRLFHLRRGSMLSPGPVRSMDDRAEIRNLFLRLPLDDCLCMMAPSLWSSDAVPTASEALHPIPSDTMTLWDNRIIAADHHDCLFVWSGKATADATHDHIRKRCKEFLLERSKTRFPMPILHVLQEDDSMSRRFTSRLAPTHADPTEQQIAHFPDLAALTPNELAGLIDKFRFYEETVDASFRRWFWSIASASSNARYEGMSLCE
mmetsp:Transcript_24375/g.36161  ORF Transcript_24375/g.36161 Transcript_24375/m.36161 type:complete len:903 (+) Transcript_24375:69-2777(+)